MFVCLWVCSLSPPRSFDGSSANFVGVCRLTSHLPLRGSFSKRLTGQRVTFTFHYIIYAPASRHTLQRCILLCCWQAAESNSAPFAAVHLNAICRCTSLLPLRGSFFKRSTGQTGHISTVYVGGPRIALRGSFSKRSTGRRVSRSNGSTGQQVTFTFTILYMIADDARLTPPRCKKHTAYDDTRLTPHHCKKHTASFARLSGKFPSILNRPYTTLHLDKFHLCRGQLCVDQI